MTPTQTPEGEIERFWRVASFKAKLTTLPGYLPASSLEMVPPPAWSFGADAEQADELLSLVLGGTKTATASAERDYAAEGEPLPEPGTMGIVLDGEGHPRALIETTQVAVVAFDEVDAEHARLEGEGDLSLAHWREVHEAFFTAGDGAVFSPQMPVVLERFRLLYSS